MLRNATWRRAAVVAGSLGLMLLLPSQPSTAAVSVTSASAIEVAGAVEKPARSVVFRTCERKAAPSEASPSGAPRPDGERSSCGNGKCQINAGEDCATCAADCGRCPDVCGDMQCTGGETCADCPEDCGSCPCEWCDGVCGPCDLDPRSPCPGDLVFCIL